MLYRIHQGRELVQVQKHGEGDGKRRDKDERPQRPLQILKAGRDNPGDN